MAQVSCQQPLSDEWFDSPRLYEEMYARAVEPDTRGLILPSEARRMSRILKRTVCTSITALNSSAIDHPDAIITGTGMGCMENSEKFLIDLSRFGENCLKPTLFMQSTHNTIGSLIAIILKCHGYNNTYSHKGISFESALLDAWLQIRSGGLRNALVGSHDEVTPFMDLVMESTHPEYSFVSEASVAMIAIGRDAPDESDICEIESVRILHRPDIADLCRMFDADHDSLLMLGLNGNPRNDSHYSQLTESIDYAPLLLRYRHIFGDNFSAPALGVYAAAKILEKGRIPCHMLANDDDNLTYCRASNQHPQRITVVNHCDGSNWSIVRLKSVKPN